MNKIPMNKIPITDDILLKNGFELNELKAEDIQVHNEIWGIDDYRLYTLWTNEEYSLKIDMEWKCTNNGANWHIHIDDDHCETIGCADINYVEQFNLMMEIFESKFKLKP